MKSLKSFTAIAMATTQTLTRETANGLVNTPLGRDRGLNALGTEGGLMYAAPFR